LKIISDIRSQFTSMKILLTGATGMVGSEVLRQALNDSEITHVTALVRSPLPVSHSKLTTIIHSNFQEYHTLSELFKNVDACIWCLGISQLKVKEEEYRVITYDFTLAGAQAMLYANPNINFVFLSGMGADNTGRSKRLFARVKGQTENALDSFPFKQLYFARPGGIKAVTKMPNRPFYEAIVDWFYPVFKTLTPSYVIDSKQLALALIKLAKEGYSERVIENTALKAM